MDRLSQVQAEHCRDNVIGTRGETRQLAMAVLASIIERSLPLEASLAKEIPDGAEIAVPIDVLESDASLVSYLRLNYHAYNSPEKRETSIRQAISTKIQRKKGSTTGPLEPVLA